jgi:hypothetical protein
MILNYRRHTILAGGGAINDTFGPVTDALILDTLTVHVSSAPTTAGYFTVTLNSVAGAAFDTVLYKLDLSTASTTDVLVSGLGLLLVPGDALVTTYANADSRIVGVTFGLR